MEPAFWHRKWADNQIGFHQAQPSPYLQRHWPALGLAAGSRVLVPLCGKSLDLAWLAAQGHRVLGIELSPRAVEAFFTEHGLDAQVSRQGAFEVWRSGDVQVWCGDFFALRAEDIADCAGLYDRAAMIALPPVMRERYLALLSRALPVGAKGLLVTLDYDQKLLAGPPFSVGDDEVRQGLAGWSLQALETNELIGESPKFQQAGLTSLLERVYRVQC
ncbi:thiopurine S-methyltransferase [Pseudomonas sp. NC26]|uniref:Thiopurine S-methyltransferase n=1 Tax=Pseudomonas putida TaxID=303 RepID=A0A7W2QKZ3_PSEPU|nr:MULTISPECIES: thiopurine S-methyltransferase [Pseudomonas]MBA6118392.1 thiopurine S-methyltransferase [Pseudomonas putida]MCZ9636547.1 thiopurine S-methyltransferase [Pseudomonas putida]MEC4879562.1 thiopurine S-methyltransferase [Pseudomonas sp. NC26]QNL89153.1 Thiopurine S-methyltransferase [Pseudomonas putida]